MPRVIFLSLALGIASARAPAQTPPPALPWQHDWKSACAKATAEKKPILVVVMKDEEIACVRMLEKVYADAEVGLKLASFVLVPCSIDTHHLVDVEADGKKVQSCAKFFGVLCTEHQAIETELRPRYADGVTGAVIVPLHVVCDSKGAILLRHSYEMKKTGYLEFLDYGLTLFRDPGAAARGARSAAVETLLDAILKTKGDDAREKATKDLLSDASPERETALLDAIAKLKAPADKGVVIRAAGQPEFKAFSATIVGLLDAKDPFVRDCAVVTLEEQMNPAVAPALLALWEREKDPEIRKDVLRALGPCGGGKPEVRKLLVAELADPREALRAAAALSLGSFLKDDAEVASLLEARFGKDKSAAVQVAILWGIGQSEDRAQIAFVDKLVKNEKSDDLQKLAVMVKTRLESDLDKMTFGHGKGHRAEIHHVLAPLVDDDKVQRHYVRALDRDFPKN